MREPALTEKIFPGKDALEAELGEPITVDGLTGAWKIFQRKKGHRHSTDDLLTGWYALEKMPAKNGGSVDHALDLGTGIGSVGLIVLSGLPAEARLTCIEAQDISFRLLEANIELNGVRERVRSIHGDLRDLDLKGETFRLITGSPPYFPASAGIVPADSQKAHARFELRGDVRDYLKAAKRHLAPDGLFVFCFPYQQKKRALDAARTELRLLTHRDVIPRVGLEPLFSLFVCALEQNNDEEEHEPPFIVRNEDGTHTPMLQAVRARLGFV